MSLTKSILFISLFATLLINIESFHHHDELDESELHRFDERSIEDTNNNAPVSTNVPGSMYKDICDKCKNNLDNKMCSDPDIIKNCEQIHDNRKSLSL